MAITTTEQTSILNLIVSMFNAAPGAANLTSIVASYEATGKNLTTLANNLAMSSAFNDQFAGLVTNEGVAAKMATNFGMTSGTTAYTNAYNYFVAELAAGKSKVTIIKAANDYLLSATKDPMFNDAAAILTNKTAVALDYSVTKQLSGATIADLRAPLATVTADAASVTAATAAITSGTGTTFTLTANLDTITGSSNNDTFIADAATASSADQITGGAGIDTFKVYTAAALDDFATLSSVEVVNVINGNGSVDLSGVTDMTTLILDNQTTGDAYTIGAAVAATVKNMANGETVTLTSTATDTTADLTLSGMGTTAAVTVNADGAAISTVNITSTGATQNWLTLASTGNEATVKVTGATAINAGSLAATVTTLNASAMTAAITATMGVTTTATTITTGSGADIINAATAAVDYTINLGAGNDYVAVANLTTADSVVGGEGTDTVGFTTADAAGLDDGDAADTAVLAKVTGFEQLRITNALDNTTTNIANLGYNYLQLATDMTGDETVSGFTSGATVEMRSLADETDALIVGMTGATGAGTNSDTINIKLNADLTTNDTSYTKGFDLQGINIVNITASDRDGVNSVADTDADGQEGYVIDLADGTAGNSANIATVNIAGTQQVSYTVNVATTALATVNASTSTGNIIFVGTAFAGTQGLTITTNSGIDTITGSTLADIINGGAGADSITGLAGLDVMTGGAGADTFTFANTATGLPSASGFDTITDFAKASDIIDGPGTLTIGLSGTASSGTAAINAEGIASFNVADSTFALKLTAVAAGVEIATATTANDIAIFEHDGASYVFISDATAGLSATDVLIKLTGVTGLTDSTITGGDLTIA